MYIARNNSPFGESQDIFFMQQAIIEAQYALKCNEVPIGAVIVSSDGSIIARASNAVEQQKTQSAHAELLAINQAGQYMNDWRLNGCWLYVTLEPCSMCMNIIAMSRLSGVVFGSASPLFGYRLDNAQSDQVYKKAMVFVKEGVCADESAQLLKQFFKQKRKE